VNIRFYLDHKNVLRSYDGVRAKGRGSDRSTGLDMLLKRASLRRPLEKILLTGVLDKTVLLLATVSRRWLPRGIQYRDCPLRWYSIALWLSAACH